MNQNLMTQEKSMTGEFHESRELSEIKGKMFLARQFPRDVNYSLSCVLEECSRPELAEEAQYEYPKGDTVVKGPSIRLVEVLARHWGNLDFGVNEIETMDGSTLIQSYAWDLQTNVSDRKVFSVKHERSTKSFTKKLTDERDIYEMVANKGARRKRACLLSVMPQWYVDAAVKACEVALKNSLTDGKSMEDVISSLVEAFGEFAITPEQIAEKMGKDVDKLSQNDIVKLRHLYSAIKDGFVKPGDAFGMPDTAAQVLPSGDEEKTLSKLNEKLNAGGKKNGTDKG